ncbi:5634_t:CDS:2 [Diversispora eburnea]|uniref:5634_t:CDS:1 n=1 Tax=Diversispora eburnea TaxID=1213867 RepID=A0A9N9C3G7_9GLOM|nr:5634_t:CDS:2 [Diversispora eburnea]
MGCIRDINNINKFCKDENSLKAAREPPNSARNNGTTDSIRATKTSNMVTNST